MYIISNNDGIAVESAGEIINFNPTGSDAQLDLNATDKALLLNRVTDPSGDISTPINGMIAYDSTDNELQAYISGSWVTLGGSVAITDDAIPRGTGSTIEDGTWVNAGNHIYPVTTGSNIGQAANRIGTIFMSSTIDYGATSDLIFAKDGTEVMRIASNNRVSIGIGGDPISTAVLHVGNTNPNIVIENTTDPGVASLNTGIVSRYYDDVGTPFNKTWFVSRLVSPSANTVNYVFGDEIKVESDGQILLRTSPLTLPAGAKLHVFSLGNTNSTRAFRIQNSDSDELFNVYDDGDGVFNSNLTIGHSGFPSARLHVQSSGTTSGTKAFFLENDNGDDLIDVLDNGQMGFNTAASGDTVWKFTHTDSLRHGMAITLTSSNVNDGAALAVTNNGSSANNNVALDVNASNGVGGSDTAIRVTSGDIKVTSTDSRMSLGIGSSGGAKLRIDMSGDESRGLLISGNSLSAASVYGILSDINNGDATNQYAGYFRSRDASNNYAIVTPADGGRIGFGVTFPNSRVHIVGEGSTSATHALIVRENSGNPIIAARDDERVGIGTEAPTAKVHITGDGTTFATTSLLLENNSGTDYFEAKDDGTVFIQSNSNSVNVLDVRSNGTTGTSAALNVRNTASGSGSNRGLSVNVANASGENNAIYVSAGDVLVGAGSIDTRLTVNTTHISDSRFYSNILDGSSLSVAIRANSQQTSGTTYGVFSDINGTNSGDNIAGYFRAINGANNYALLVDDGFVGIGTTTPTRRFQLDGNLTQDAWGLDGIHFDSNAAIFTDDSTAASGTATNAVINSFGQPILAATNSSVTTTNAATIYVAGAPTAGTNQTITNAYSLWIDDGLVQIDDALVVGNPTGGDQGTGTINAVEVYDDGSLLTDYVFDHYLDNKIKETDIKNNPELKNYKRYSLKQAWNFVKDNHHLPTMVGREEWLESRSSLGQLTNQLWETVENQFLYIKELEERIDKLEKTQTN